MSEPVIRAKSLGKQYRIGVLARSNNVREAIVKGVFAPLRRLRKLGGKAAEEELIWALKDVSFEVQKGEVVGVIGCNGAGKTTLLKVLSKITEPTEGEARVRGRVASLLQVGAGFHQELTGRENVFLNGAVLGMTRREIQRKFDEIVSFAEVEKFIDTPVKRYSSGMYVRLAFAVAAHLEPEILLVDEVLAVGDVAFRKKCLGKMKAVAGAGRTVLFVSHNMVAIRRLCARAMLFEGGHLILDDTAEAAVGKYLSGLREESSESCCFTISEAPGDEFVRLKAVRLTTRRGRPCARFRIDEGFMVKIDFVVLRKVTDFHVYIRVLTEEGTIAFGSGDWDAGDGEMPPGDFDRGVYHACTFVPGDLLNRGRYTLTVIGQIPQFRYVFYEEELLEWEISDQKGAGGTSSLLRPGVFRPRLEWEIERIGEEPQPAISSTQKR